MQNFLSDVRVEIAVAHGSRAAGMADINGAAADMKGYEGITTIVEFGTIAATAVTAVKMQESDASGSGWADVDDSELTVAADDDNQIFTVDLSNVRKRYARVVIERATADATLATALYVKYNPSYKPTAQPAAVTPLVVPR